jgi:enoyl-CoA hydratase
VAIGLPLPDFGIELARDRLSKRHFTAAAIQARLYDGQGAVDAGYADRAVDPGAVKDEAIATAQALTGLSRGAYADTKRRSRAAVVARIRESLTNATDEGDGSNH